MYGVILALHIVVCLGLVAVVLVQSGKGGGLAGGAFGGSAQTVFGGRGATDFITRATILLGSLFFATSLTLALLSSGAGPRQRSLIQEEARRATQTAPAPVTTPPPPGGTAPQTTPQTPPSGTPPGGGR